MSLIGSILSFPYMVLFFAVWLIASLFRPVVLACCVAALTKPVAAIRKIHLFSITVQYLLFCSDKTNWKAPKEDPQTFFSDFSKADSKTVIFVRHGESTWNDTFNKGDRSKSSFLLGFLPNLIKALYYEIYFFVSGQENESWFFDSPLSEKGRGQALGIQTFLREMTNLEYESPREQEMLKILMGQVESQLVSSNLRRAISTMAIGFQQRLEDSNNSNNDEKKKKKDTLLIIPQLQEMSRNPDAQCITPAKTDKMRLSWTDPTELQPLYDSCIDTRLHSGNKAVDSNGLERMRDFCRVLFEETGESAVVAGGHSLYFRNFFKTFLPHSVDHISKRKKIKNGGCVGFTLLRIPNEAKGYQYMIDPKSIVVVYGGFQ